MEFVWSCQNTCNYYLPEVIIICGGMSSAGTFSNSPHPRMTRLRWASAADATSVARLWHRAWHDAHASALSTHALSLCELHTFERRVGVSLFERNPSDDTVRPTMLVMERCNDAAASSHDVVAFAVVRGGAELEHIFVDSEVRGTRVASKLLAAAEDIMRNERGCDVAHLVVAARNARAIRFYEKNAWISTDRRPWMTTAPWVPVRPPELRIPAELSAQVDHSGGLTELEHAATRMRCRQYKK